jgi:addiction module HigA family antidote
MPAALGDTGTQTAYHIGSDQGAIVERRPNFHPGAYLRTDFLRRPEIAHADLALWARMQAESDIDTALEAGNIDTGSIQRLVPDDKVPHGMSGPTVGPEPAGEQPVRIPLGTHPGKVLRESFLEALDISPASLAENIGVPAQTILDLAACRTPATIDLGIRLARALGTTPGIWTRLQADHDIEQVRQQLGHEFEFIERMTPHIPVPPVRSP